jgi:Holliday junction DNA helicase RuvB
MKLWNLSKVLGTRDMFDGIKGYEDEKWIIRGALKSEEPPVHVLLVGPPGIGKTRFLKAIEEEYGDKAYFALSNATTSAGIINQCFIRQPRYLLLDEIEEMNPAAQASILSLLQDGVLVETKISKTRKTKFKCTVIATCNKTSKLKEPLLSRFAVIEMKAYSDEEFKEVVMQQMPKNPLSGYIAEQVLMTQKNPNVREALRIGQLARSPEDVHRYLARVRG